MRIATHGGALIPLAVLIWDYASDHLTVNPIQAAEQRTGDMAILLLLLCLACTPLSTLTGLSLWVQRRKALGLYAFFYASLHLVIYLLIDYRLDGPTLWESVQEKPFILAGWIAFLLLLPLAVTSFRWWMKRLKKNWRRLHALIYPASVLAILHFAGQVKGDFLHLRGEVGRPLLYSGILILLLFLRLPGVRHAVSRWRRRLPFWRGQAA